MSYLKKIVITGALGHIGSRVIREVPKNFPETEIVMIDNLLTQRYCSLFNLPAQGKYRFIEADILETDLDAIIEGADVVLHLAAIKDAANSFRNKEEVEHVNYNTTARVAKACRRAACCMIHLSSTSVYGTQSDIVYENCSPEELNPQSPYAETKLKEEKFLQTLDSSGGFRFVICRLGTICGISPGMRFHTAVNKFCWQAVMGQPLSIWKTALHQKRPYLTLGDAIASFFFIIKNNLFNRKIYNVLTDNLTVNAIVKFIEEYSPDPDIQFTNAQIMNQLSYEVSNKLFREQGFEFKGDIKQDIYETIHLLKSSL